MTPAGIKKNIKIIIFLLIFTVTLSLLSQDKNEVKAFSYGMKLYNDGLYDMALLQFRNFVKEFTVSPKNEEALFLTAECYFKLKQYDDAAEAYLNYLVKFPQGKKSPAAQFNIARCFEEKKDFKGAVEALSRLVLVYPSSQLRDDALLKESLILIKTGEFAKAESALSELRDLSAKKDFKKKALYYLADLYLKQNKYREADTAVNELLSLISNEKEKAGALLIMSRLYIQTGRLAKITDILNKYLSENENLPEPAELWYMLGISNLYQSKKQESLNCFLRSSDRAEKYDLKYNSLKKAGEICLKKGDFANSEKYLLSAVKYAENSDEKIEAAFLLAESFKETGKFNKASNLCDSLIELKNLTEINRKKLILFSGYFSLKSGKPEKALKYYSDFIEEFNKDPLVPDILLLKGKIFLNKMNDFDGAGLCFRKVLYKFKINEILPEARYLYGLTMERSERFKEAEINYKKILNEFPCSSWCDSAKSRLDLLKLRPTVEGGNTLFSIADLISSAKGNKSNPAIYYNLAQKSFNILKDYNSSIKYYKKYLNVSGKNNNQDSVKYLISMAYFNMSVKENKRAYADSAIKNLNRLINNSTVNTLIKQNSLLLSAKIYEKYNREKAFNIYRKYISEYPDNKNEDAYFYLGEYYSQNQKPDSSVYFYTKCVKISKNKVIFARSLFQNIKINYKKREYAVCDSLSGMFLKSLPKSIKLPEVYFYRAVCRLNTGNSNFAETSLNKISREFTNSVWSDSSVWYLANYYFKNKRYAESANLCKNLLEKVKQSSLKNDLEFNLGQGLSVNKIYRLLGRLYEFLGDNISAESAYRKIDISKSKSDRKFYYHSLVRIAEKEHRFNEAIYLLQELYDEYRDFETAARLGRLFFSIKQYDEAEKFFNIAINHAEDDDIKMRMESDLITAMIRQGKIPQANVRIKIFVSQWKSRAEYKNNIARFSLEKGKEYIKQKEFKSALTELEIVKKKYGKSPYTAEADLEKGRALLITNKIEDALTLLTKMVQDYKNDPIIYKIYLNLGDYYFRSNQYNIALEAFSKAVKDTSDENIARLSMKYLIRVYDMLRMYDSGLYYTRKYIEKFPYAEDVIQKKVQVGNFLMKLHEYQLAIKKFREVYKYADFETRAEIQYWIGKSYAAMGIFRQAIFEFLKVKYMLPRTKLPWAATALYEAGQCYLKLDQPDKAKKIFRKIVLQEGAASDLGRIAQKKIDEIEKNGDKQID